MVEIINDVVVPSEFILPDFTAKGGDTPKISGAMWFSGGQIYFYNGVSGAHLVSNA